MNIRICFQFCNMTKGAVWRTQLASPPPNFSSRDHSVFDPHGGLMAKSSEWHIYFSYHSIVNIFNKLPTLKKMCNLKRDKFLSFFKKKKKKELVKMSPKKTYGWLTNTWKNTQHYLLLEKCKYKLQWDTTSHWSEWPSSKSPQQ